MNRLDELSELMKERKSALPSNLPLELVPNDYEFLTESELKEWHDLRLNTNVGSAEDAKFRINKRIAEGKRGRL